MWDLLLTELSIRPFAAVVFSFSVFFILKAFRIKGLLIRIISYISLAVSVCLSIIFHFVWDSFSIHFDESVPKESAFHKILFIGDSITHEGNRPKGFITKLKGTLPIESNILAKSGANTSQVVQLLQRIPLAINPDLVIAQSGINDISEGIPMQKIRVLQMKLLNQIRSSFPTAEIWFLPIHPISPVNETPHFSFHTSKWWEDSLVFKEKYLLNDGIHLSAKGQTKLAIYLAKKLGLTDRSTDLRTKS